MAGAPQGDQGGEKNTYYILWVMALIAFVGGIIWYFFDNQLKVFFIFLRKVELNLVAFVFDYLPLEKIPLLYKWQTRVDNDLSLVNQLTPANLTLDIAEVLSAEVGQFLVYPLSVIMAFLGIYIYRTNILMRYTKKHNMKTLAVQECEIWPQIKIVTESNILEADLDSGPWGMGMTPMQFCKKYQLVTIEPAPKIGTGFSKTVTPDFKIVMNRARVERALSAQLGRPWQGVEALLPHRRAIFTALAAKGCRDSKAALEFVYQLARSAGEGKLNLNGMDELLKKHLKNAGIQKILNAHAYEFTVMASLLLFAREDGVAASCDFLWVKPIDRRFWYVLNNVGRQTPLVEVAGIFSHWYNELALKRPLSVPVVSMAVDALDQALADIFYEPDDKERDEIMKRYQEAQAVQEEEEIDEMETPATTNENAGTNTETTNAGTDTTTP